MKTLQQIEPRIPINSTNTPGDADSTYKISRPGNYYLTDNLIGEFGKAGIEIEAADGAERQRRCVALVACHARGGAGVGAVAEEAVAVGRLSARLAGPEEAVAVRNAGALRHAAEQHGLAAVKAAGDHIEVGGMDIVVGHRRRDGVEVGGDHGNPVSSTRPSPPYYADAGRGRGPIR